MGKVLAVVNQKGGVGKTVTVSSMASILTEKGYKVLSVSMDPQQTLDMIAGEDVAIDINDMTTPSMLHALQGYCSIQDCIVHTQIGDLARASCQMSQWVGFQGLSEDRYLQIRDSLPDLQEMNDSMFFQLKHAHSRLRELLFPVSDFYDFIFIDPNPALTLLTLNSVFASDYLIVPAQADYSSARAIQELASTVITLNHYDPDKTPTKFLGILMTRCMAQTTNYKFFEGMFAEMAESLGTRLFRSRIRQSTKATEIVQSNTDLPHYSPHSKVTADYLALVDEVLAMIQEEQS